jgi:hypothetical protein
MVICFFVQNSFLQKRMTSHSDFLIGCGAQLT